MLPTFPTSLSAEELLAGNPFPDIESGFPPWNCFDLPPLLFEQPQGPVASYHDRPLGPVMCYTGSEDSTNPNCVACSYGSDEPNQINKVSNSGSDDSSRTASVVDERKRRRMLSNRESARRSRMRKQKHVENLRNTVSRLKVGNRELTNRLRSVIHHSQLVVRDNDRLRQELWNVRRVLLVRQQLSASAWPNNFVTSTNEQNPTTLT